MTQITLTEEQSRSIEQTLDPIDVVDPRGNVVGSIIPPRLAELIATAKRRIAAGERCYPSELVMRLMQALQAERDRNGAISRERVREIVSQIRGAASE